MGTCRAVRTIKNGIQPILAGYWHQTRATYAGFGDSRYFLPSSDDFKKILSDMNLPPVEEFGEVFDCDEYALAMKAHVARYARLDGGIGSPICIGIAWGRFFWTNGGKTAHACNWGLTDRGEFFWIEPQLLVNGFTQNAFFVANRCAGGLRLLLV